MNKFTIKEIMAAIEALGHDASEDDIEDYCIEARDDLEYERDRDRDVYDTPTLANCDDWGTGEGRYHGRM